MIIPHHWRKSVFHLSWNDGLYHFRNACSHVLRRSHPTRMGIRPTSRYVMASRFSTDVLAATQWQFPTFFGVTMECDVHCGDRVEIWNYKISTVSPQWNERELSKSFLKTPKYSTLTPKKVSDSIVTPKKVLARCNAITPHVSSLLGVCQDQSKQISGS